MRLLNVETLQLEQFEGLSVPPYAILSHRWEEGELLFADVQGGIDRYKPGFRKVHWTCGQAYEDGLHYAWIDTCCIDKTSSAELSEAINSMFDWYEQAHICYVYLSDVHQHLEGVEDADIPVKSFPESIWFSRGWTLQELIAPKDMKFFGYQWQMVGTRDELRHDISKTTGIDAELLTKNRQPLQLSLSRFSIAHKMSWAANRRTTRIEDRAYSLLGLFGVNMPLLYGEGLRAFARLQEEILKNSTDLSILAWDHNDNTRTRKRELLACTPNDFASCHNIINSPLLDDINSEDTTFELKNTGLRINGPRMAYVFEHGVPRGAWVISLNCRRKDDILGVLALKVEPLKPVVSPKSPMHNSKVPTVMGRVAELPTSTSQASSHEIACYAAWDLAYENDKYRIVSLNVLEPAVLPDWTSVTLLRQFTAPEADRLRAPSMYTHVWFRPPDDARRPPWKVLDVWPRENWNTKDLIFDVSKKRSNRHDNLTCTSEKQLDAAIALLDPLMGFAVVVCMRGNSLFWHDIHIAIKNYNVEVFPNIECLIRDLKLHDFRTEHFLDVTKNWRIAADVKDIKRPGIRIAQVIMSVDYQNPYTGKDPGLNNAPQELVGSTVDSRFFEKHTKVSGARDKVEKRANIVQRASIAQDPANLDARVLRYAELLRMEEQETAAKKTTKEAAKKASDAAVVRWVGNQMYFDPERKLSLPNRYHFKFF